MPDFWEKERNGFCAEMVPYATDVKYLDKICSIMERFRLDKYDPKEIVAGQPQYVVQTGAFSLKKNARKRLRAVKKLGGEFKKAFYG